jgi:hypothetical protein
VSPPVRQLTRFSLGAFVLAIVFGTIRAAPTPLRAALAASPEAERAMASFHTHFDALCFVGAAALALLLNLLGEVPRAPAWTARALAGGYAAGSAFFSFGYAVKGLGLLAGQPLLWRGLATAMISGGGLLLLGAAASAALLLLGTLAPEGSR